MDAMLSAIKYHCLLKDEVPVIAQAKHEATFKELRLGYIDRLASSGIAETPAKPLRRTDIQSLLNVNLHADAQGLARSIMTFASMDLGLDDFEVLSLAPSNLQPGPDWVGVTSPSDGRTLRAVCTCRGVSESVEVAVDCVPEVCLACLLNRALEELPAEASFAHSAFGDSRQRDRQRWNTITNAITNGWSAMKHRPNGPIVFNSDPDDEWARRGTRLGLLDYCHGRLGERSVLARLAAAWSVGLKGVDEPSRLLRRHVRVESDLRVTLDLPGLNADEELQGDTLVLPSALGLGDTTATVICWLAVSDAFADAGEDTPTFCSFTEYGAPKPDRTPSRRGLSNWLHWLQDGAGLSGFNWHSTRAGFAVAAFEDGADVLDVQAAMRSSQVKTALRHSEQASTDLDPVAVLHAKVATGGTR